MCVCVEWRARSAWWGPPGKWLFWTCSRGVFSVLGGGEEREEKEGETRPETGKPPTLLCPLFAQCVSASRGVGICGGCEGA